jgi:hypothetical protein
VQSRIPGTGDEDKSGGARSSVEDHSMILGKETGVLWSLLLAQDALVDYEIASFCIPKFISVCGYKKHSSKNTRVYLREFFWRKRRSAIQTFPSPTYVFRNLDKGLTCPSSLPVDIISAMWELGGGRFGKFEYSISPAST